MEEFIEKYQLKDAEVSALKEGDVGLDAFFDALERAQEIHKDCKGLLQSGQQSTALEIMDQMSQFQESALERLYRWAQSQCRNVEHRGGAGRQRRASGQQHDPLARAMRHLRRRPVMFRYVLDEYCAAQKQFLVKSFLDALTVGGPGGTPRPIELHAHDPPRYIGDMLAWLHQAIPGERETTQALLKLCDDSILESPAPAPLSDEGLPDVATLVEDAIAAITEDVSRPLRARVEQILMVEQAPIVLHRLASLIKFYTGTIKQVVPETGGLVQALLDLDQLAYKQFLSVLQYTVQQQLSSAGANSAGGGVAAAAGHSAHDLAPTRNTMTLLALMKEILSSTSVVDEQESQLTEIVSSVVDPILEDVTSIAASFPSTDADVFQLNSLYQVINPDSYH